MAKPRGGTEHGCEKKYSSVPACNRIPVVQLIACHFTYSAI